MPRENSFALVPTTSRPIQAHSVLFRLRLSSGDALKRDDQNFRGSPVVPIRKNKFATLPCEGMAGSTPIMTM